MNKFRNIAFATFAVLAATNVKADESLTIFYATTDIDLSAGGTTIKAADLDGFGLAASLALSEDVSLLLGYTSLKGDVLTFASTLSSMDLSLAYDIHNDLSFKEGSGTRLRAGIGYGSTKLETKIGAITFSDSVKGAILGANFEAAISEKISVKASVAGMLKDFKPTYGIGGAYKVGGGKVTLGYSAQEEKVAGVTIKGSGFNIGYTFDY